MKERATEKDAPEQGPGQFPAQAASAGWLRGWLPAFMSELSSSVRNTVLPDALAVWPLGGQDGVRHPEVAQPCGLMRPSAKEGGVVPPTLPARGSLPAPGMACGHGGHGSAEHSLKNEVVKDPVRFWQFPPHNICLCVNTMFSDGPSSS